MLFKVGLHNDLLADDGDDAVHGHAPALRVRNEAGHEKQEGKDEFLHTF